MITFKDFIAEDDKKELKFEDILHGDCSNYFKQSQKNALLIRGVSGYGQRIGNLEVGGKEFSSEGGFKFTLFKRTVRKARRPMDTAPAVSKLIDDWFEDNTGIRARSEALFCFGEAGRQGANQYGDPVVVLPIGKFSYTWSPEVEDLYDVIRDEFQHNNKLRDRFIGDDGKPDLEAIDMKMKSLKYTMNRFSEAVKSTCEIMIDCEEYYVIPYYTDDMLADIKKAFVHA